MPVKTPLTNLQLEIIELYATGLSEEELKELKTMLAKFYAERAIREADRLWDERHLTNADMERWLIETSDQKSESEIERVVTL